MKTYEIAGKNYVQKKIVLGQLELLVPILSGLEINAATPVAELVRSLGSALPEAIAVVVVEEGSDTRSAMQSDALRQRAQDLSWGMDLELAVEVVTDFFALNPISSIGAKVGEKLQSLRQAKAKLQEANSNQQSMNSAPETSPGETLSCGVLTPIEPSSGSESEPNDGARISSGT
ncbi:MAG: hypothetical protein AAGU11_23660 [Syntrophobacteraceae bacterium]